MTDGNIAIIAAISGAIGALGKTLIDFLLQSLKVKTEAGETLVDQLMRERSGLIKEIDDLIARVHAQDGLIKNLQQELYALRTTIGEQGVLIAEQKTEIEILEEKIRLYSHSCEGSSDGIFKS